MIHQISRSSVPRSPIISSKVSEISNSAYRIRRRRRVRERADEKSARRGRSPYGCTYTYSRAALFTVIVATDKPVAFPRRLIISRRKRKGLSPGRNPYLYATILPGRVYICIYTPRTYVRSTSPRTYFHGHQRRVIIGLHF